MHGVGEVPGSMAATVQAPVALLERFTVPAEKLLPWAEEVALKNPKVALRASTATAAMAAAEPAAARSANSQRPVIGARSGRGQKAEGQRVEHACGAPSAFYSLPSTLTGSTRRLDA